jgi:hypothetical protein
MLRDIDLRKWVIAALLVLHVAWIANHMRLVASDQINPWRLGGYAMYTVPRPSARLRVLDAASPETPIPVSLFSYMVAQRYNNPGRTFRCAHTPTSALRALIHGNKQLIGKDFYLVISEKQFVHNPPSVTRRVRGVVKLTWQDTNTFTYVSKICDTERTGTAKLDEQRVADPSGL